MRPVIALLSDFGTRDHYAGTMKGVMIGICPDVTLLDISHDITPHDVMEGALRAQIGSQLSWDSPKGGFFIWATLRSGCSDQVLLDRALAHGLVFVVGSAFFVDGSGHDKIRLSFSAPAIPRIEEGVRRLAIALNELLDHQGSSLVRGHGQATP